MIRFNYFEVEVEMKLDAVLRTIYVEVRKNPFKFKTKYYLKEIGVIFTVLSNCS